MLKISLFLISSTTFIRILSFHRRSLGGTTQIVTFGIHKILVFSKIIFLNCITLKPNSFFNSCSLKGIRMITRLHLELSHLREQNFKYNFQKCLISCSCGLSIESTSHFLPHCPIFNDKTHTLLNTLNNIDC